MCRRGAAGLGRCGREVRRWVWKTVAKARVSSERSAVSWKCGVVATAGVCACVYVFTFTVAAFIDSTNTRRLAVDRGRVVWRRVGVRCALKNIHAHSDSHPHRTHSLAYYCAHVYKFVCSLCSVPHKESVACFVATRANKNYHIKPQSVDAPGCFIDSSCPHTRDGTSGSCAAP